MGRRNAIKFIYKTITFLNFTLHCRASQKTLLFPECSAICHKRISVSKTTKILTMVVLVIGNQHLKQVRLPTIQGLKIRSGPKLENPEITDRIPAITTMAHHNDHHHHNVTIPRHVRSATAAETEDMMTIVQDIQTKTNDAKATQIGEKKTIAIIETNIDKILKTIVMSYSTTTDEDLTTLIVHHRVKTDKHTTVDNGHTTIGNHTTTDNGHTTPGSHMTTDSGYTTIGNHMTTDNGHTTTGSHMTTDSGYTTIGNHMVIDNDHTTTVQHTTTDSHTTIGTHMATDESGTTVGSPNTITDHILSLTMTGQLSMTTTTITGTVVIFSIIILSSICLCVFVCMSVCERAWE